MNGVLFVTLSIVATVSIFLIVAIWFFRRNGMRATMMVALPFAQVWKLQSGDTIPAETVWPMLRLPSVSGYGDGEKISVRVVNIEKGSIASAEYRLVTIGIEGRYGSFVQLWRQVAVRFPNSIKGEIIIHRIGKTARFGDNDEQLESIDFNRQVIFKATSQKLAFEVFSPDFMEWYLKSSQVPPIHFLNNELTCLFFNMQTEEATIKKIMTDIVQKVLHSGGLKAGK